MGDCQNQVDCGHVGRVMLIDMQRPQFGQQGPLGLESWTELEYRSKLSSGHALSLSLFLLLTVGVSSCFTFLP